MGIETMPVQTLRKNGREYVILPRADYDELRKRAELPALPKPDADGNLPALEYLRVSIARDILRDRLALGWTQKELAKRAGVRVETLCRIETGKHTASTATIDKLDRALKQGERKRKGK
jgi:ribosome-binding protein aMBF1 (putative translation factor)